MDPLRVLIADDHPLFRNGIRALLSSVQDMEVAGVATKGEEAVALATSLQPDVILMDLQMPGNQRYRGHAPDSPHKPAYPHPGSHYV